MNRKSCPATLFVALILALVAVSSALAVDKTVSAQGYKIEFAGDNIELQFPDGSILYTPRNADLKTLEGVHASGDGMAKELLDQAYAELGLPGNGNLPKAFNLAQNYPNPFNPSTTVSYSIPEGSGQVKVELRIFNLRGQEVRTLVNDTRGPGQYTVNWDGTESNGRNVSSGVYFYRISAGDFHATRKMVILK